MLLFRSNTDLNPDNRQVRVVNMRVESLEILANPYRTPQIAHVALRHPPICPIRQHIRKR